MNLPSELLRTILTYPAEDAPRLIAADWWEERGEVERAEFIRVQCELAVHRDPAGRPPASETNDRLQDRLERRERELFADSGPRWLDRLRWWDLPGAYRTMAADSMSIETADGWRYFISRGFVSTIRLPLAAFMEHAEAIFAAQPIEAVRLSDREPAAVGRRTDLFSWIAPVPLTDAPEHPETPHLLPQPLFVRLKNGLLLARSYREYPTTAEAHADLSQACVALGRERAGL